jgi:hypothetical protein
MFLVCLNEILLQENYISYFLSNNFNQLPRQAWSIITLKHSKRKSNISCCKSFLKASWISSEIRCNIHRLWKTNNDQLEKKSQIITGSFAHNEVTFLHVDMFHQYWYIDYHLVELLNQILL